MSNGEHAEVTAILLTSLYERGDRIPDWPADEAEAYRVHRFVRGIEDARALRMSKAAAAVLDAGYTRVSDADRLTADQALAAGGLSPALSTLLERISGGPRVDA